MRQGLPPVLTRDATNQTDLVKHDNFHLLNKRSLDAITQQHEFENKFSLVEN